MVTYRCYGNHDKSKDIDVDSLKKVDRIYTEIETSECPICNSREHVEVKSQLFWCKECRVPTFDKECGCCHKKGRKFVTDCRIVFPEEKLLLELILGLQPGNLNNVSVWNGSGNIYYADGKRLLVHIAALNELDTDKLREEYHKYEADIDTTYFDEMLGKFVKANERRLNKIEGEAIEYIHKVSAEYKRDEMFISFSGGKDSTVVADLVRRATANAEVLHIFGDTTLEFPETYRYVEEYKKKYPKTLIFSSKNKDKNFEDLCELLGPPSRVMRWCCTIFKTGSINRKIEALFARKPKILSFQGIRRSESASRSKYDRTSKLSKVGQQIAATPIIDWFDFDVWLYIATKRILFNRAYRLGYARVGCWCCPNNSTWSEFLSKIHMPKQYNKFHKLLVDFAVKVGKPDPNVYVDNGKWKARQGGNGVSFAKKSLVKYTPCVKESDAFNYELTRPISDNLYELFKPFGKVTKELGNKRLGEVYILSDNLIPVLRLQGKMGDTSLKIIIDRPDLMKAKDIDEAKRKLDCQITKYQMCIGCRACESVCKFGAIKVSGTDEMADYRINDSRCVKCQECVSHFNMGCYMRKVLTIKR